VRTIAEDTEKVENIEEENEEKEDKKVTKMGRASSVFNRHYQKNRQDLYNELVSGSKPSLRNLFNVNLTRDDKLKISRNFVWNVGILYRIIKMKVDFIIEGFRIYSDKEEVKEFYDQINEEIDIEKYIRNSAFEHQVIGEWYPFLSWNGTDLKKLTILNPEQVSVKSLFGEDLIYLKPTQEIMKLLNDPDPETQKRLRKVVPSKYYNKWSKGEEVLLDENEVFRYFNQKAYHEGYSHTPIEPIFDDLALLEMHKESDYSVAYKIKKAILQIKVGDKDFNEGDPVDEEILEQAEELFSNPSEAMEVFTQWFMEPEWILPDTDVYNKVKYEPVIQNILEWSGVSLFISDEASYSGAASIRTQGFFKDVKAARSEIRKSIKDIYREIAEKRGFKTYGDQLKMPEVKFSNLSFHNNEELLDSLRFLYSYGLISPDTALDEFGFDIGEEFKIQSEEGKKEKYLEHIITPFEPSQDVNMQSMKKWEHSIKQDKGNGEEQPPEGNQGISDNDDEGNEED